MNQDTAARHSYGKRLIVVLGMHRSGTSAITRGLTTLGVSLGAHLMPPKGGENPSGFWEDLDIYQLNVDMLDALGTDWHQLAPLERNFPQLLRERGFQLRAVDLLRDKLSASPIFAFKDPKVTLLLPFWKDVFAHCDADVSYLLVVRNPISVIKSLTQRNQFDAEKSAVLWLKHCVAMLEGSTEAHSRVLVEYDILMESPEAELRRIAAALSLPVDPAALEVYCSHFLDGTLRHATHRPDDLAVSGLAGSSVQGLYSTLHEVAIGTLQPDSPSLLDQLERSRRDLDHWAYPLRLIDTLYDFKKPSDGELSARDARVHEVEAHLERARADLMEERKRSEGLDATVTTLREAASSKEAQFSAAKDALRDYQLEVERLTHAIATSDQHASALTVELESLKSDIKFKEAQLQTTLQKLEYRHGEVETLQCSLAASEQRVSALLAERGSLSALLVEKDARMQTMSQDLAHRQAEVEKSAHALAASENRVSILLMETESLRVTVAERDSQLGAAHHLIEVQGTRLEALSYNCGRLEERTSLLAGEIDTLNAEAESQRAKAREQLDYYETRVGQLADIIGDREQRIVALQTELESALQEADRLDSAAAAQTEQLCAARSTEGVLRAAVTKGRERAAALEVECDVLRRSVSERDQEIQLLRGSCAEAKIRFDNLQSASHALQIKLKRALADLALDWMPAEAPEQKILTLPRLLELDGTAFVKGAYQLLLLRAPDVEGQHYYEDRLRSGVPKMQILTELAQSEEGSRIGADVPALKSAIRRQWLTRAPIVGRTLALALNAESTSPLQTRVRALRQLLLDAVRSSRRVLESIDEDVRVLYDLAVMPNKYLEGTL